MLFSTPYDLSLDDSHYTNTTITKPWNFGGLVFPYYWTEPPLLGRDRPSVPLSTVPCVGPERVNGDRRTRRGTVGRDDWWVRPSGRSDG